MQHLKLRKMPFWLAASPWLVIICALLLAAMVFFVGVRNAKKESEITIRVTWEKGTSIINSLEGALRSGMGFRWNEDELQEVLSRIASQPQVQYLMITDSEGHILTASNSKYLGQMLMPDKRLASLKASLDSQWTINRVGELQTFMVYKILQVPRYDEILRARGMRHHRQAKENSVLNPSQTLLIFVGFNIDELQLARSVGASSNFTISAILVFMGITGGLGFALVQAYRHSRLVVQEATAFTSEVIKTLPMGIIATNELYTMTTVNHTALKIMGYESQKSPLGQDLRTVLPGIWAVIQEQMEAKQPVIDLELRCDVGYNQHVPLALYASCIVAEEERLLGYALIMRDLGEIRHLQAELRRRDRLVALGNMAAGIAHEIRNPLGAIKGLARFFEEVSPANSQEQQIAKVMSQEVGRLDKVVGDMLNFAKPDVLNCKTLSLDELAQIFMRVRTLVQTDMDEHHIKFRLEFPETNVQVWLDPDILTQAILNLYLNAVQAMPEGGELNTTANVEKQSLEIYITDTGIGIPPEKMQHVFSPYFTTKASGTGLGLSIVHKIIEAHDGAIEVQKAKCGVGTTFTLRFPLHTS